MAAYYNENDPKMAAWLTELIRAGLIAEGDVDVRSIELVRSSDLRGFTQCHFFAGIGGWSYALRRAGWPDDRPVWTGSCPCQPFSDAGKKNGADDSRHLWPTWFRLIQECRPDVVFGEQVASADGLGWFDRVSTDLEGADYAVGAADLCAASVGAFHIRQRVYFVAKSGHESRWGRNGSLDRSEIGTRQEDDEASFDDRSTGAVANDDEGRRPEFGQARLHAHGESGADAARRGAVGQLAESDCTEREAWISQSFGAAATRPERTSPTGVSGDVADTEVGRCGQGRADAPRRNEGTGSQGARIGSADAGGNGLGNPIVNGSQGRLSERTHAGRDTYRCGPQVGRAGFWGDAEWIPCRDGKARPIEPGSFPLAHGVPARVGRLRGYGNAIVPQVAAEFVRAYMDVVGSSP